MYFIGTALVFLGFLDFGLYFLGNVSSSQLSFIPPILVFDDKDFTGVAVIVIGYFLRDMGKSDENPADGDTTADPAAEQNAAAVAPEQTGANAEVNTPVQEPTQNAAHVPSWWLIDSWLRNTLLNSLFATISGSPNWFYESPGLRFFGRLFLLALIGLLIIGVFAG